MGLIYLVFYICLIIRFLDVEFHAGPAALTLKDLKVVNVVVGY